jgi:hypothetical protein
MADDGYRKPFRSDDSFGRTTGASLPSGSGAPAASDPLAELARLIGQTDPFAEFGRTQRGASGVPAEPVAPAPHSLPQFDPPHYAQTGHARYPADHSADPYETSQYGLPFGAHPNQTDPAQGGPGQFPAEQAYADGSGYDPTVFAQDHLQGRQDAYYDDVPPPRRRLSVLAIAGVFALAVVGTAGALGYRAMFGSSGSAPPPVIKADTTPSKVVPPAATAQSNKLINDRIGEKIQSEKLVSREEQPVDLARQTMQTAMTGGADAAPSPQAAAPAGNAALYEPKKVKTIAIRPDQPASATETTASAARSAADIPAPQPAAHAPAPRTAPPAAHEDTRPQTHAAAPRHSANAPLSLTPGANAPQPAPAVASRATAPQRVASAPASSSGNGGYAVQISSQRSEADAQQAFRNMQGRYPTQLGGRQVMIRRADLGSKGVYYRAMIGPFANAGDATELCNSLKAAGGQCIVQKI